MTRTMLPTITVLALLVGISGCFYPSGRWRGGRQEYRSGSRQEYRDPHYVDADRNPPRRDCWRQGSDLVCRSER
jgi:hypothetical protein